MKLILVRHGETDANVGGILQGKLESTLTLKGREQAKEAGKKLKQKYKKIDMVFCSPLKRCVATLDEILSENSIEANILMSKLLEERGFGEYEGVDDYMVDWEKMGEDSIENKKMGVESLAEMEKRINLFLEDLKLEDDNLTVLVVSHWGPVGMIISKLTGKKFEEIEVKNAEIVEFDYIIPKS